MTPEAKAAAAAKRAAKKAAKLAAQGVAGANNPALQDNHVPASDVTIVTPEQEQPKPVLNKVFFRLYQDTVKTVNKTVNGVKTAVEKTIKHHWEATFETDKPITSQGLAAWITAQLANYQVMQQYQGRSRFDTSLPIEFDMQVNDKGAEMGLRFSTNAKAIEKIFDTKCPALIGRVFSAGTYDDYDHTPAGIKRIKDETVKFVSGALNVAIAPRVQIGNDPVEEVKELLEAPIVDPTLDIPLNK
jgi:hypothetical protein